MSPYSEFSYMFEDAFGSAGAMEAIGAFLVVYLIIMAFASAYGILVYVLQSVGLYSIAKRRGIHNPWLAWLPIGNVWIQGCISDQYQYVAKGKKTGRRKILLGLSLAAVALAGIYGVLQIGSAVAISMGEGVATGATFAGAMLVWLVTMLLAVISMVFQYITMYDLYCSCDPDSSVVYLVLSILINFCTPILYFICRNKDLGMPAPVVRPAQPVQPVRPALADAAEEAEV